MICHRGKVQVEGSKASSMSTFPKNMRISTGKKLISIDFHQEKCLQLTSMIPPKLLKKTNLICQKFHAENSKY